MNHEARLGKWTELSEVVGSFLGWEGREEWIAGVMVYVYPAVTAVLTGSHADAERAIHSLRLLRALYLDGEDAATAQRLLADRPDA